MPNTFSTQIRHLLQVAIEVNKKVGGVKAYEAEKKAKDKFSLLKDDISKKIHVIKNAMERKPLSKSMSSWTPQQDEQIKQKLRQINSCLIRIKQSVQDQKSSQNAKNLKFQIIQKLQESYRSYEQLVYGNGDGNGFERTSLNAGNKYQTLTDMKAQLLGDTNDSKVYSGSQKKKNYNQSVTQIQMEKMNDWKKRQQAIDDNVDGIIQRTLALKASIKQAGSLVDQVDAKVKLLTTNVQDLTGDLSQSNKKLKGIVKKFRTPGKFCIDVILVIIFIGLIVGCIQVSRGP